MKSITINGSQRESVGKVATKALRNAGMVPCVVYGGDKPVHFSAPELSFKNLIYTPDVHTVVIVLEDGVKVNAILQDIQFHPVTDRILHMDFYQIYDDKEVMMEIPVITLLSSIQTTLLFVKLELLVLLLRMKKLKKVKKVQREKLLLKVQKLLQKLNTSIENIIQKHSVNSGCFFYFY